MDECLKEMEEIAGKDIEEFANLVKLFEEQKDEVEKLNISNVLTNLKYEKVKDFLIQVIEKGEDYTDKIWAAGNLLKFEDERAVSTLKELIKEVDENNLYWLLEVIGRANNLTSIKLALYLADTYEKINNMIDRSYFENKLKEYK